MKRLIPIVVIAVASWLGYDRYQHNRAVEAANLAAEQEDLAPSVKVPARPNAAGSPFKCDGRKHCSQMTSCAEATYFLKNCPGVTMDGDHDGIPCEKQWCRP